MLRKNFNRKSLEGLNQCLQILIVVIEASEAFYDLKWCPRLSQEVLPLMKSKLNKTHKSLGNFEFDLCFPTYIEYLKTVVPKFHKMFKSLTLSRL